MKTSEFDYDLPPELIAQTPSARRDEARLLVVHRATRAVEHRRFFELSEFLRAGDILIRNTARVRPARLFAQRRGGGRVECLLLRPAGTGSQATARQVQADHVDPVPVGQTRSGGPRPPGASGFESVAHERWWCLLRPGRRLPPGAEFAWPGEFTARVLEKSPGAEYLVAFTPARAGESVAALAERLGRVPLPPYIRRDSTEDDASPTASLQPDATTAADRERYQTVFADRAQTVAVAAPTAGLHFSEDLLARLAAGGVQFLDVILHVGLGTFRPIETTDVATHPIHRETMEIPAATRRRLAEASTAQPHPRRIAVGTTSVRAVEHYARIVGPDGLARPPAEPFIAEADLFIHPPAEFAVVDALITNFHLPRSTLLCLVAAFLTPGSTDGVAWLREIYAEAIRERYRFLSYGDAMVIL